METAMRDTQVGTEMEALQELCNEIREAVTGLEDRLSSVLRGPQVQDEERDKPVNIAPSLVMLASIIRDRNSDLRVQLARLNDIRGRVEL